MNRLTAIAVAALFLSPVVVAADWFGQPPGAALEPIGIEEVLADPDQWLEKPVALSGRMTDVCTNKGCWAVFESGGEMLRIVARDHGFAIPEDARGPAVAHGVLERRELSPEAAEHMVEEDGADAALLDDPVEYRLVADGVRLQP
ncbi:DUF4920 domain-containing protein [Wenzhouxiangella sp. EGI_FJ10409]|uniref:DUF4920 domain-containing protein n=1 Tax=Wenzhouxiangella sp. EGI_FJ10409 TaxID=3243767 RepID=UPI0035D7E2D1